MRVAVTTMMLLNQVHGDGHAPISRPGPLEVVPHPLYVLDDQGLAMFDGEYSVYPDQTADGKVTAPGYDGELRISGYFEVYGPHSDGYFQVVAQVQGADPRCENGPDANQTNSCGMHIHNGTVCSAAGGHHYDRDNDELSDPWEQAGYTYNNVGWLEKVPEGLTVFEAYAKMGFDDLQTAARVALVHDYDGTRVACVAFTIPEKATPAPPPISTPEYKNFEDILKQKKIVFLKAQNEKKAAILQEKTELANQLLEKL